MSDPERTPVEIHYFVDEAGDPAIFGKRRKILLGKEGCSDFFILGKLDVPDPFALHRDLETLRAEILADPYLRDVPSLQPERKRTAVAFHANNDPPEVRHQVYRVLLSHKMRFYAVVRDKRELLKEIEERQRKDPVFKYKENDLYDLLVRYLFGPRWYRADRFNICFATRGTSLRTEALREALEYASRDFEEDYGFKPKAETEIDCTVPRKSAGLQAVDYFLWALQRFYEKGEERYIKYIWDFTSEVYDLDHVSKGGGYGTRFRKEREIWNRQK